jgi:hypothetical protein
MPVVDTLRKLMAKRSSKLAVLGAAILLVGCAPLLVGLASAAPNPAGNNGTIKIDNTPFDDLPNNEPHVGCNFQVDFYGFDAGDLNADVTFEAHPPTLRPGSDQVLLADTVFIGEDDNSGGGSVAGLDASKEYTLDLTGITPHPNQGVHVKLTIHADGAAGNDTKYKVFWVTGCAPPGSTTTTVAQTTTTTVGGTTTTTGAEETTTTAAPTTTVGEETTTTAGQTTTTAEQTTTTVEQTTTTSPS